MQKSGLTRKSEFEWIIEPHGRMRVPGVIFADEQLIEEMDDKVRDQVSNVAGLPGIVKASFAMPDAHWGYGFPIGGVAAFDPDEGGVVSAGGVGFDISCGVRTMLTGLPRSEIEKYKEKLADVLFARIPAGVGSRGDIRLSHSEMDAVLRDGAEWAVRRGYGMEEDLERIEERGRIEGADPSCVSRQAKQRQLEEMGTLGSGNHYLEVQEISEIFDEETAAAFGLRKGETAVSIHCGSRGLGHQIGTDFLREMAAEAARAGIALPERELACAPIRSEVGRRYLGAMRAAINCALANRQILGELTRRAFREVFPDCRLSLLYDVSHNTCKEEEHAVDGARRTLFVHRKGATRAWGPGHPLLPEIFRGVGQPVLVGGTMGTASFVMVGTRRSMDIAFGSAIHGAGRRISRRQATRQYHGGQVIGELARRGIVIRAKSQRGVAEEAPAAYKDVSEVVEVAHKAGLARKVARLEPLIVVKG